VLVVPFRKPTIEIWTLDIPRQQAKKEPIWAGAVVAISH
jgi:hypothetical protein